MKIKLEFESVEDLWTGLDQLRGLPGLPINTGSAPMAAESIAMMDPAEGLIQSAPVEAPMPAPVADPAPTEPASIPAAPIPTPAAPAPIPTPTAPETREISITQDDLIRKAMSLMDRGMNNTELMGLLTQFGVEALPDLPKEQFAAFNAKLEGLEAKLDQGAVS